MAKYNEVGWAGEHGEKSVILSRDEEWDYSVKVHDVNKGGFRDWRFLADCTKKASGYSEE